MRENPDPKLDRRTLLKAALGALVVPTPASAEEMPDKVRATVASLTDGMQRFQGKTLNPRESGFKYHPELLEHYARGLKLRPNLSPRTIIDGVQRHLSERIKIFKVTNEEERLLRDEAKVGFGKLQNAMMPGEVSGFIYLSDDRSFQRQFAVKKNNNASSNILESYPVTTSAGKPKVPRMADRHKSVSRESVTPLGLFKIPKDGVQLALPGEVTKIERLDVTRYYFQPIMIDGRTKYFVKDFNATSQDEFVTVTGDTHLLWSPEIEGRGIKIHDTTEIASLEKPASSGCIRTPSVRRFTMLTSENKYPTQIYIYWSGHDEAEPEGFGGVFGGERVK